jgi:glycosyltransferase involved in cell wall biosynthesis
MNRQYEKPSVSIIIPTFNSAENLPSCLQSVRNQTYKHHEVIVVDGFSTDETVKVAERFGAHVFRRKSTQAEARNVGVEKARGKYVLFMDSDQTLSPSLIEECVEKFDTEEVGMVRIPEVFVGTGYWSVCSAIWKNTYENVEFLYEKRPRLMHGEPRFFVKARLQDFGVFDTTLVWGEDYELYERLRASGVKEGFCSSVMYHQEGTSIKQILLKNLRYAESMPIFVKQTNSSVFPKMTTHALLTFIEILKSVQNPAVAFGCFFLLLVKSSSMLIGLMRGSERYHVDKRETPRHAIQWNQ